MRPGRTRLLVLGGGPSCGGHALGRHVTVLKRDCLCSQTWLCPRGAGLAEINPAVGAGLCVLTGSPGDSDAPGPAPGQALILGPVAKGPVPGRCPASLQSRGSWGLTLVPGLFSQQQEGLGSMGREEAAVSPSPPLTREWGVRKQ